MFQLGCATRACVQHEILSGLTVALALVPEAVAFAFVAGVDPLAGLYAAFIIGGVGALIFIFGFKTETEKLKIDDVRAELEPKDKQDIVKELTQKGALVLMAGDGINDAPALAQAEVGVAMGTGTDVAIESAGITLVKGDLNGIVKAIKLSRSVMHNIRQNLFFAFIYNAVGVPIAAGILYPFIGLLLNPMIAGAAMSFSSVSVISNSLRLRAVKL